MATFNYIRIAGLVSQIKLGDSQAFADIYTMTYQKVYYFSLSILRDEQLAEDAVQETYIRVLNSISSLHDNKLFISWLNKIAYSVCIRMLDKNKPLSNIDDIEDKVSFHSEDEDPLLRSINNESRRSLMKAILEMPESYKTVIILKYFDNMKIQEISEILGIPPGTVKSRIFTAKQLLKENLSKERR